MITPYKPEDFLSDEEIAETERLILAELLRYKALFSDCDKRYPE